MKKAINILQIFLIIWVLYIFLGSLPFKFSGHEHTQFIFETIGAWMSWFLGSGIWNAFWNYAAYVIGTFELIVSIILISGLYFTAKKNTKKASIAFASGWTWAMFLMIGAAFFHLATPLGIEVNGDGGSLFRAAVSIIFIGGFLAVNNGRTLLKK